VKSFLLPSLVTSVEAHSQPGMFFLKHLPALALLNFFMETFLHPLFSQVILRGPFLTNFKNLNL